MDEAERCHKLAYIASGELLARGTAAEVIAQVGLTTFEVHGANLMEIDERLRGKPGVEQTVVFGNVLHVSGRDAGALEQSVEAVAAAEGAKVTRVESGLEDAFISLMKRAPRDETRREAA
jgi:ABC-2 type transport system ATP-binding protein